MAGHHGQWLERLFGCRRGEHNPKYTRTMARDVRGGIAEAGAAKSISRRGNHISARLRYMMTVTLRSAAAAMSAARPSPS